MKHRNGFTLIELLVVIAIIAILAAILFPVFLAAKAKGQQVSCMDNMKQIGSATYTYLGDWNETYPMNRLQDPLMGGGKMDGTRFNWKTAIYPYIKNRNGVWRCSANIYGKQYDETGKSVSGVTVQKFPRSYAINGDFFNNYDSNFVLPKVTMSKINQPTRLLFVVESRFDAPDLQSSMLNYVDYSWARLPTDDKKSWMTVHYGGVSNFLFTDCHAKAMKVKATLTPRAMWYQPLYPGDQSKYDSLARKLAPEYNE